MVGVLLVLALITLAVCVILYVCAGMAIELDKKHMRTLEERERQRDLETEEHRQRLARQYAEQLERDRAAAREIVAAEQKAAEAEATAIVAAAQQAAANIQRPVAPAEGLAARDDALRELLMMGAAYSEVITVKYLGSPTGRVGLDWVVHVRSPVALRVVIERDGQIVSSDYSPENRIVLQLARGRTHAFRVSVYDGSRVLERDIRFAIPMPTPRQWNRTVDSIMKKTPPADAGAERRRKVKEKLEGLAADEDLFRSYRRVREQHLREEGVSDKEFEQQMAMFDGLIEQFRTRGG